MTASMTYARYLDLPSFPLVHSLIQFFEPFATPIIYLYFMSPSLTHENKRVLGVHVERIPQCLDADVI